MQYSFKQIAPTQEDWNRIEAAYDSTCYQSQKWYQYLERIHYKPFIVSVNSCDSLLGYFLGEKVWMGFRMITAPLEGIGTYTQGLVMMQPTDEDTRVGIYQSLVDWIFSKNIASYVQIEDWQLRRDYEQWIPNEQFRQDTMDRHGLRYEVRPTLHVPVNKPEEELWAGLSYKSCKYCVNKAKKLGLRVRTIDRFEDIPAFCKEHYAQLLEVCLHKGVKPKVAQKEERMRALCESLFPDRVMMVECVGPDADGNEVIMSTGIYCIDKGQTAYWTGASWQRYQKNCPNELMVWEAMRMLSQRGAGDLNFCGMASYKLKFGTVYAYVPRMIFYKHEYIYSFKEFLKRAYYNGRQIMGKYFIG